MSSAVCGHVHWERWASGQQHHKSSFLSFPSPPTHIDSSQTVSHCQTALHEPSPRNNQSIDLRLCVGSCLAAKDYQAAPRGGAESDFATRPRRAFAYSKERPRCKHRLPRCRSTGAPGSKARSPAAKRIRQTRLPGPSPKSLASACRVITSACQSQGGYDGALRNSRPGQGLLYLLPLLLAR